MCKYQLREFTQKAKFSFLINNVQMQFILVQSLRTSAVDTLYFKIESDYSTYTLDENGEDLDCCDEDADQ